MGRWQKFGHWRRCGLVVFLVASLVEPAKAELPTLIPRKILFSNPQRAAVRISPDGKMLSYVAPSDKGVANVFVEDLSTQRARMVTRAAHRGIYDYAWAFDGKHLLYFSDENGNEDFHLYSVDLTNEEVRDLTPFAGTRAQPLRAVAKSAGSYWRAEVKGASVASAFAHAAKTVSPLSALRSPEGARITATVLFNGAHTAGSVGPKSKMHFAPAAAANWEMPLSWPRKIASANKAARRVNGKFFAKRTRGFFQIDSSFTV